MAISPIELLIRAGSTGFNGVAREIGGLEKQLNSLQSVAAGALSFAGIGLGAAEIIQLADSYGQMTGKLKIATQYSGDFADTMDALRNSARASRSDLGATVNLYTQLSPALKGIGLSANESIGIITTIGKAIAVSGASSQAAEAALMQLGQGFASGALRGEELNSIMEQTPALAQAIADGLGVSRGALRDMGAEGKLTAEVVATALQKVAEQVNGDFAKMPVTVGQAFTKLRNEFMVFVGAVDGASGGTSALADAISGVADEFATAGPAVTAFSTALTTMANGLDGIYRLLKVLGTGLAGYAAAAEMALKGNFAGAKQTWADLGKDIDAVLQKPIIGQAKAVDATSDSARKRQQLEQQLADETKKLEQLKAFEAGKALDNIAAKEKANIDARIADQKRLVDAVRSAWQESLKEAEKYADSAKEKLTKATDFRDAGKSAAFSASLSGMSEPDQLVAKQQRMSDLQSQAGFDSARARSAALAGDIKKYDSAASAAEKRLKEALQLAQDLKDVSSIESISGELAKNQESGAKLDTKKSEEAKAKAADQAKTLSTLQAELDALLTKARSLEVQADVTKAESAIKGLKAQLEELKDKTVTVTVNSVNADGSKAAPVADGTTDKKGFAVGGWTGPGGKYQPAGIVHGNEFVIRSEAVRQAGAMAFLSRFNAEGMKALRGYSEGGLVERANSLASVSFSPAQSFKPQSSGTPLVLDFGKLGRFSAEAPGDTAKDIERIFKRAALGFGKR